MDLKSTLAPTLPRPSSYKETGGQSEELFNKEQSFRKEATSILSRWWLGSALTQVKIWKAEYWRSMARRQWSEAILNAMPKGRMPQLSTNLQGNTVDRTLGTSIVAWPEILIIHLFTLRRSRCPCKDSYRTTTVTTFLILDNRTSYRPWTLTRGL